MDSKKKRGGVSSVGSVPPCQAPWNIRHDSEGKGGEKEDGDERQGRRRGTERKEVVGPRTLYKYIRRADKPAYSLLHRKLRIWIRRLALRSLMKKSICDFLGYRSTSHHWKIQYVSVVIIINWMFRIVPHQLDRISFFRQITDTCQCSTFPSKPSEG